MNVIKLYAYAREARFLSWIPIFIFSPVTDIKVQAAGARGVIISLDDGCVRLGSFNLTIVILFGPKTHGLGSVHSINCSPKVAT